MVQYIRVYSAFYLLIRIDACYMCVLGSAIGFGPTKHFKKLSYLLKCVID